MEIILQHGAIKIRNMFRQNKQLKIKYNQLYRLVLNLQLHLNQRKNKIKKTWMTGHQVMEIILLLGAIKIRSMYKLLRKPILNKKVKQQLKQKLKLNLLLLKIQKLNKTKKIWKIGGQDMEITLQLSTKMINSWFRQNQKWTLKQNPKQRQRDLKKWYHQLSLK
jgi:hypothetical protein